MKTSDSFDLSGDKDAKLAIITSIYSCLITNSQELRRSAERLTIWGSGLILLLDGWFIAGDVSIGVRGRLFISLGVVIFGGLALLLIKTLHWRYNGVAHVIRKINEVQMTYANGVFLEGETLFPEYWKTFGTPKWKEPILLVSYLALTVISLFGAIAIWLF